RSSNYIKKKQDDYNFFKKWENIFYDKKKHNIGKIEYINFIDIFNTAEVYRPFFEKLLKENPEIFIKIIKKTPFYRRVKNFLNRAFFKNS
ncbi:hypothetical protein L6269_04115, partial [Candidatus Dependentiae bacterium]|nr:hypothetical protein [Candidatus Dependentiae bacterium]